MTRRWALATVVASLLIGVVSAVAMLGVPSAGAGTIAPLTAPTPGVGAADGASTAGVAADGDDVTAADVATPGSPAPSPAPGRVPSGQPPRAADDVAPADPDVTLFDDDVAVRSARLADHQRRTQQPTPVRVRIPELAIDARVDAVGVDSDGSMTVPQPPSRLGWYEHGPAPGDAEGSAVIAGHVDSAAHGPGAFFELGAVEPGATVVVTLSDGTDVLFEVTGRQRIDKEVLPTDDLFRRTGPGVLTLVTCGGDFDTARRSYTDNVVVVAVEQEQPWRS